MDRSVLEEIIININNRAQISPEILEKDYYVCLVLKEISTKQDELQAYFKGGTAIYKILNHMNRFSEDIDLTVKINENESNNSNKSRLKKSALGYNIPGLELIADETVDKKGSITSFYKYDSLFHLNTLYKSGKIQIEATSFTISEPVCNYIIEPLIYKYASKEEKIILKNEYNVSEFSIGIIKLERIFIDKVFATEFYYERQMYDDVAKHLYDIAILMQEEVIKILLRSEHDIIELIEYKREEEKNRIGGIESNKKIIDFKYFNFGSELNEAIFKMQDIYVLDDSYKVTIDEIHNTINNLYSVFCSLYQNV